MIFAPPVGENVAPDPGIVAAETALAARHPRLSALMATFGPCTLVPGGGPAASLFEALASAIVSQQLAGRAAAAIWSRVRALDPECFAPDTVVRLGGDRLRSAGLSGAKAAALADLAQRILSGALDLDEMVRLEDEDVTGRLCQVRGIGRWTAQMFLMFRLGRLDVWPAADLGVRRGYAVVYGLYPVPGARDMDALGEAFRPWRSVAAWYCWRALDSPIA